MDLLRKVTKVLDKWRQTESALIVYGARQVGKTYTLKKYISENFKHLYYLNLHNNVRAIKSLVNAVNIDDFISRLSLLEESLINEETCIFIDEIQEYYTYLSKHPEIEEYFDIIYQTKSFVSEHRNRIVLSGSLLRLEMENYITSPVGYLLQLEMFPLDFEEYIINHNIDAKIIEIVKKSLKDKMPVPDYIHNKLISLINEYILVGGMPNAVSSFLDNKNFLALKLVHNAIEDNLKDDITKYASDNEKLKVREIYDLIPTELSNPSRKFILSDIPNFNRNNKDALSFSWLNSAGITIPVYFTSEPAIPLISYSKRNQFKLFLEDVGLLSNIMFSSSVKLSFLDNQIVVNKGFIYENFVAQELHAHGFKNIHYYNSRKFGEVDFLLEIENQILPIEVKSGKNNNYHRALNNIMDVKNYHLNHAIVLSNDNVKIDGKLIYYPIYAISFLDFLNKE